MKEKKITRILRIFMMLLTCILIALFFGIMILVSDMQGTARVVNCAAEFAAETPYYYSVYGSENEVEQTKDKKKVLVLGSGPIRIGQGIEFDFCSVHCTWAFAKEGYETIIINNNPETVSTDFDIADKLYFEP